MKVTFKAPDSRPIFLLTSSLDIIVVLYDVNWVYILVRLSFFSLCSKVSMG